MATTINHIEMNGTMEGNIQARYSAIMNKYVVSSKTELKAGRGIKFDGIVSEYGAGALPNKTAGWFKYYMTEIAFKKLENDSDVVLNLLLD